MTEDECAPTEFTHQPVMLAEALDALTLRPGARAVDGTVGGGGHAAAILEATAPDGWLFGCDRDGAALEAARRRLAAYAGRFELRQGTFAGLAGWLPAGSCDSVLLDLGVSSHQLDTAGRGFSFLRDGPLDMRMDPSQGLMAAALVNELAEAELAKIFIEFGGERNARRFARLIVRERAARPFETTLQLAGMIERVSPRAGRRTHPATKIFQALRCVVNDEANALRSGLAAALKVLKPGGRLAIITFNSMEDRIAKDFGRARARDYTFPGGVDVPELREPRAPELKWLARKAITPGDAELAANPRSRSAQLRVMEKI
jgi:16S rRNA (cytosine1402-N4)-methyltransferase